MSSVVKKPKSTPLMADETGCDVFMAEERAAEDGACSLEQLQRGSKHAQERIGGARKREGCGDNFSRKSRRGSAGAKISSDGQSRVTAQSYSHLSHFHPWTVTLSALQQNHLPSPLRAFHPHLHIAVMVEKRPFPGDHGSNGVKRPKPTMPGGAMDKVAAAKAMAEAKAAEIKARLTGGAAANGVSPSPTPPPSQAAASASGGNRLAELKARLAKSRPSTGTPASTGTSSSQAPPAGGSRDESESRHTDSKAPRFATTLGNRRTDSPLPSAKPHAPVPKPTDEKENPYFDPKAVSTGRDRVSRGLLFNQRGKYLDQASKLRAQNRLEQLKKILADKNRRAKLDENSERGFLVPPPPDVEWWDEGILEDKTYDCIEDPSKVKIDGDDSIITIYVQHPVLLKAPQDQLLIPVKPMYLTSKEQAKLRRMRRADEHKEQQAKIRLGLEPPPPPKVKRGNMMRVMGEQAIADPTAVEMLVESQIQDRHEVSRSHTLPQSLLYFRS